MKGKLIFVIALFAIIAFSVIGIVKIAFLKSPEEKVIEKIEKLTERIRKDGSDFNAGDWESVLKEISAIHDKMEDCDFTSDQLKAVGKAEGELTAAIAKQATGQFEQGLTNILLRAGGFAEGLMMGIEEININEISDALINVQESIEAALNTKDQ